MAANESLEWPDKKKEWGKKILFMKNVRYEEINYRAEFPSQLFCQGYKWVAWGGGVCGRERLHLKLLINLSINVTEQKRYFFKKSKKRKKR